MYRKIGQLSLRKNKGKVANDYLTQTCEINIMQKFVICVKIIIGRMYEIDEQK